jgi:hypothetical protein
MNRKLVVRFTTTLFAAAFIAAAAAGAGQIRGQVTGAGGAHCEFHSDAMGGNR